MPFLAIEYPITRQIHWRYITALSYVGAFVVVVFLTILNVALVGYDTITVFESDYDAIQDLWFHRFLPYGRPKPGTLCDPYLLSIGDHFKVQGKEMDWTTLSITAKESNSKLAYTGTLVSSACDVTRIAANISDYISPEDIYIILECWNLDGVYMNASAPLLSKIQTEIVVRRLRDSMYRWLTTYPVRERLGDGATRRWSDSDVIMVFSLNPDHLGDGALWNVFQTIYAIVRVNLANDSPNNFLLHPGALPTILLEIIPQSGMVESPKSGIYDALTSSPYGLQSSEMLRSILNSSGGEIEAAYLCKQQHLKSPGNLVISVLVAVLSMFSTIWAAYMWILSTLAKRPPKANTCIAHGDAPYHSVDSLQTTFAESSSREENARWIEFMQMGYDLNKRRYERRPSFVADEIVLTSLPHARH
ncbi:hypothetical protein CPB83DRAFT_836461 [Crepidotus variabilis]|uniref:Uncharacterized protein n=1 Tax=Crepidotus variabilis TaxID=179855 RepID=A0A9P6JPK5_9AGAR|nr:hypothetical protein CPB83DRAFT_836461 [Crepidotus variabilis]